MRRLQQFVITAAIAVVAWQSLPTTTDTADAEYGWEGRRRISYQHSKDLFYNQYVGPGAGTAAAEMYVSPLPVPERVGHTYGTYQPFYPNEYLYRHKRSYYNYHPGAGWTAHECPVQDRLLLVDERHLLRGRPLFRLGLPVRLLHTVAPNESQTARRSGL